MESVCIGVLLKCEALNAECYLSEKCDTENIDQAIKSQGVYEPIFHKLSNRCGVHIKVIIRSGYHFLHLTTHKLSWYVQNWDLVEWLLSHLMLKNCHLISIKDRRIIPLVTQGRRICVKNVQNHNKTKYKPCYISSDTLREFDLHYFPMLNSSLS